MTSRPALVMLGLCTTVLVLAALYFARSILAPVAFSLFVIAIVWPLQRVLQARMPALLALLATLVVTLVVMTVLGGLIAWSFGTVGRWLIDNAARFQLLYMQLTDWLEGHGILLTSLLVDNFNASWLIRAVQEIDRRRAIAGAARVVGHEPDAFVPQRRESVGTHDVDAAEDKCSRRRGH